MRILPQSGQNDYIYRPNEELAHILMKVETHNHPTAISPFPARLPVPAVKSVMKAPRARGAKPKAG